jgi:hypothetical protein
MIRTKPTSLALLAVPLAASPFVLPQLANAAPGHQAASAGTQNVVAAACSESDAQTVAYVYGPNNSALTQLIYSASCRTIWAKATSAQPVNGWDVGTYVLRNDNQGAVCHIAEGARTCTTGHINDAGYQSYAKGFVEGVMGGYQYFRTTAY